MPDAFLTGGSGFIGGALLAELRDRDREVSAQVRSRTSAEKVAATGATAINVDLFDVDGLAEAMAGCATVFHVAGVNEMCSPDPRSMVRTNVEGTRAVIRAAAAAGVDRVVLTSSAAAIGEPHGTVGNEASPHRGSYLSNYEKSKHLGEVAAFEEAARLGVDLRAVLPSSVQGPGRTGGTARLLIAYLKGRLRVAVDTTISLLYVDDCVEGHLLAESSGVAGERYVLSDAPITMREALEALERNGAPSRSVVMLPPPIAHAAGGVMGAVGKLLRRQVPLCPEMVRTLLHGHRYDGAKATRELGLTYTPIDEALRRTVDWYRSMGLIER